MDAFTTPVRPSKIVLAPQFLDPRPRNRHLSDSSEEDSPVARPLFDTPDEPDGLTLSVPMEEGGLREAPAGQAEGRNDPQVDDAWKEGDVDAFTTPVRPPDFVLAPLVLAPRRRKRYLSDSSEEYNPVPQPLFDTPDEPEGLTLSVPLEEGELREPPAGEAEGRNEPQVTTNNIASDSTDEQNPACFCSTPKDIVAGDDGYTAFKRSLGMELAEPVPPHQRKKVMRAIVRVAVSVTLNYCLSETLFEDCEGCVIDAPGQRSHDCVTWASEDINCKLRDLCAELCFESLLNSIIGISYILECLCLTAEHLDKGVELVKAVQFAQDPSGVLKEMTKPEDACLERYMYRLVRTKSHRVLLRRQAFCNKSKRIKLETGEGLYTR